jgi:hypothetical protein
MVFVSGLFSEDGLAPVAKEFWLSVTPCEVLFHAVDSQELVHPETPVMFDGVQLQVGTRKWLVEG